MSFDTWRTNSDIRWTFVRADTVTEALVQLARILDDHDLEQYVSHLHMDIDDDGAITVAALTEMTHEMARRRKSLT